MFQFKLYAKYAENSWLFEFTAIILSCGLIIALCDILAIYNGRDTPTFGVLQNWGLTLNTVVSILANVSVFSATAAVTSCLGQLKWRSFAQSARPLGEFETYDAASRGLTGSIRLLWKIRVTSTASLGAILVILQISIAPLAQQSVQTEIKTVPLSGATATAPWARTWDRLLQGPISPRFPSNINYSIPLGMKGAILGGLISNSSLVLNNTLPSCSSGNCDFDDYLSLAVCSSVSDVSHHVRDVSSETGSLARTGKFCIQDNHCLDLDFDFVRANITSAAPDEEFYKEIDNTSDDPSLGMLNFQSIAYKDHLTPIADGLIIYQTKGTSYYDYQFSALEFVFEWCVAGFSTNVTNDTATTVRKKKDFKGFRFSNNNQLSISVQDQIFEVAVNAHYALQRYMGMLLSGAIVLKDSKNTTLRYSDNSDEVLVLGRALGLQGLDLEDDYSDGAKSMLPTVLGNVAISMTNYIRSDSTDETVGTVYVGRSFVVVQWGWLAAPIAFVVLSVVFFAAAVVQGGHHRSIGLPLWKSNCMAALRILDPQLRLSLGPLDLVSSIEDEESQIRACLVRDEEGWVLTQENTAYDQKFVTLSSEDHISEDCVSESTSLTLRASESNQATTTRPMSARNDSQIGSVVSDASNDATR